MMKKYIKINKFLILLIILSVLLYRSFTYPSTLLYYYELFINCKFTYVKLLLILLVSMDIIYELITIYIINKYSIKKKRNNHIFYNLNNIIIEFKISFYFFKI